MISDSATTNSNDSDVRNNKQKDRGEPVERNGSYQLNMQWYVCLLYDLLNTLSVNN